MKLSIEITRIDLVRVLSTALGRPRISIDKRNKAQPARFTSLNNRSGSVKR